MPRARRTRTPPQITARACRWNFATQCNALKTYAMGVSSSVTCRFSWRRRRRLLGAADLYFLDEEPNHYFVAGGRRMIWAARTALGQSFVSLGSMAAAENYAWWTGYGYRHQVDVIHIKPLSRGFAGYCKSPPPRRLPKGPVVAGARCCVVRCDQDRAGRVPIIAEDMRGSLRRMSIRGFAKPQFPGMKIVQFAFGGDGNHEFLLKFSANVTYTGTTTTRQWAGGKTPAARSHRRRGLSGRNGS